VTLSYANGTSVYTNNQGSFYISDTCHPGNPSIGPGYVYQATTQGKQILAPGPSTTSTGDFHSVTGLAVFSADLYHGWSDPNWQTDGLGHNESTNRAGYESVQGNICASDMTVNQYRGVGVLSSSRTNAGTLTSSTDYLWAWWDVYLGDSAGAEFKVTYKWRFYPTSVRVATLVTSCPGGTCPTTSGDAGPYVKMPKLSAALSGPNEDYQRMDCNAIGGGALMNAIGGPGGTLNNPNGGTVSNHCGVQTNQDNRGSVVFSNSSSGTWKLTVAARAQPASAWGPDQATYAWESSDGTNVYGLDHWAVLGASQPRLPAWTNPAPLDGCSTTTPPPSSNRSTRDWEFSGDDGTNHAGHIYYDGWQDKSAFFKGWEDGNGPTSCPQLYDKMVGGQTYANYFTYQFG
jgi:hypothetical protein